MQQQQQSRLEKLFSTIHLIYHRNKNQHGKTAWWKWLSILRRSLLKLLSAPRNNNEQRQMRISKYLHTHVIPKAFVYVLFLFICIIFDSNLDSNLIFCDLYIQCILNCRRRWPVFYPWYRPLSRPRPDEEDHPSPPTIGEFRSQRSNNKATINIHDGEEGGRRQRFRDAHPSCR